MCIKTTRLAANLLQYPHPVCKPMDGPGTSDSMYVVKYIVKKNATLNDHDRALSDYNVQCLKNPHYIRLAH